MNGQEVLRINCRFTGEKNILKTWITVFFSNDNPFSLMELSSKMSLTMKRLVVRFLSIPAQKKTNLYFRYEGKTGEERILVIFRDIPMNNHINGELWTRPFH